jgi:hypothetical protein
VSSALVPQEIEVGEVEHEWPRTCPRCGEDRSGLLGNAHDFINDCPSCRRGVTGVTGPTGPMQDPTEPWPKYLTTSKRAPRPTARPRFNPIPRKG